ncbi:MAG: hypothetical protein K6T85_19315 [Gorillibacterium sp.]|nr:hypothetical protein [Gorillibacterium sp.]
MFREDLRGNWFGGGTKMIFIDESTFGHKKEVEFYIINEQEFHLIRVRDRKQTELLAYCMFGPHVNKDEINWLIDKSKGRFTYFDSVEDYVSFHKSPHKNELDDIR